MLVVTTDALPGHEVRRVLGEVIGATGRLHNAFVEGVRMLERGDRNPRMSQELAKWRAEAVERMIDAARQRGANAVVGMRFDHRDITDMWGEICAYGTAVYVVPVASPGSTPGTAAATGTTAATGTAAAPGSPGASVPPAFPGAPSTGTAPPPTRSTWLPRGGATSA